MLIRGREILLAELTVHRPFIFLIFLMKHVISSLITLGFRIIKFAVQVNTRNQLLSKISLILQLNTIEIHLSCMITTT